MGTFVPILMMLLSYLVGSIPVGYLIGKSKGIDIRSYGSHNIGATNASRTLGKGYGFIVFLLDFFKAGIFVIISKYLFNYTDEDRRGKNTKLTYNRYSKIFNRIRDELKLNPDHRPHDGRKHFVTKCKDAKVDEYAIKYMVGHKISDITEKVYTAREFEWLRTEIEKIK